MNLLRKSVTEIHGSIRKFNQNSMSVKLSPEIRSMKMVML